MLASDAWSVTGSAHTAQSSAEKQVLVSPRRLPFTDARAQAFHGEHSHCPTDKEKRRLQPEGLADAAKLVVRFPLSQRHFHGLIRAMSEPTSWWSRFVVLVNSHGHIPRGKGWLSGVIAFWLACLCALGVLAFRFPEYLTTPELRRNYDVTTIRYVMFGCMLLAAGISLTNILLGRMRWLSFSAFAILVLTELGGGPFVPVADFPDHTPYLGLDWLLLDLLGSAILFVFIEKIFALRKEQPVFRPEWQTDLKHFAMNHLAVGAVFLATNHVMSRILAPAQSGTLRGWVHSLPYLVQLFLIIFTADLVQYWVHRALHEVPALWRFHAVHHSVRAMDWLAGSRQSFLELVTTRALVFVPVYLLGFTPDVLNAYVVIVGFQAVFNHANVSVRLGPLSYIIVTPNFHHWHHAQDREAIDRNYAAHFAFIDHMFGTAVYADRKWPDEYGVVGHYIPDGFFAQQIFPFSDEAKKHDPV